MGQIELIRVITEDNFNSIGFFVLFVSFHYNTIILIILAFKYPLTVHGELDCDSTSRPFIDGLFAFIINRFK